MKLSYFIVERQTGSGRWVVLWSGDASDAGSAWRMASRWADSGENLRVKHRGDVLLEERKP